MGNRYPHHLKLEDEVEHESQEEKQAREWLVVPGSNALLEYWMRPYRRLLVAMLHRAIVDLAGGPIVGGDKRDWKTSAEEWFASEDESPFTFRWVLQELELNRQVVELMIKEISAGSISLNDLK